MGIQGKVIKAYTETRRILRLSRKPKRAEFKETAKITGLGMILIGLLGFIILLISELIRGV
ncbi:MAG: protein translocase SEC61 complex subunit gamma [Candidatus Altiarchaeales archaeon ex4484_43]|nr:MAG: protein translocase SEC61 complex subunit gamma [Candidatus Altiarchaeales archaeon ex4484_43]